MFLSWTTDYKDFWEVPRATSAISEHLIQFLLILLQVCDSGNISSVGIGKVYVQVVAESYKVFCLFLR
jgi:hypothetical protein